MSPYSDVMTVVTLLRHKKEPDDIIDVRLTHINRIQTHLVEINLLGNKRYVGFLVVCPTRLTLVTCGKSATYIFSNSRTILTIPYCWGNQF